MAHKHVHVYVSADAWYGLLELSGSRFRIAPLFSKLPGVDQRDRYKDTRPDWMRNDLEQLEAGQFPMWSLELPRDKHTVQMSSGARVLLYTISTWFVITNHQRSDSWKREMSRVSAVLEALGLHFLTIVSDDTPPDDDTQASDQPEEIRP